MHFRYRATDASGKIVEGTMDADGEQGVVVRLHGMGFIPLKISSSNEASLRNVRLPFLRRDRVGPRALLYFTQELHTLLGAGLPLDRSLSVLTDLVVGDELKRIVAELLEAVRAGKTLSGAMSSHTDVFPRLYVNMVRAGESGGVLDIVLGNLGEYLERSIEFKEELKAALIYPVSLAVVACLSLTVLFIYVIPKFALIFRDVGDALPWITVWVINFSTFFSQYAWVFLGVLVAFLAGFVLYIGSSTGQLRWDQLRLRLWLIGSLLREIEVARFSRTLAILLKGGVPLLEALGTVHGVVQNAMIRRAVLDVQNQVKEGKGMAAPLERTGVFPALALHMIGVGEETGRLEGMLTDVARHYDQQVKRTTKRLTAMIEPVLILAMGGIVGTVVVSILMAIFSINELPM